MNRLLFVTGGLLAGWLGLGLLLDVSSNAYGFAECGFQTPSSATGSCGTPKGYSRCEDQTTNGACTNPAFTYAEVKQDFPTSCVNNKPNRTNCNTPDAACWRGTKCVWVPTMTPQCQARSDPNSPWTPAPKRTEGPCPGG
jgi:hypothetical protein